MPSVSTCMRHSTVWSLLSRAREDCKMNSIGSAVVLEDRSRGVEVVAKATRRRYTAEDKFKVLREADACREPGEIGALLRRGGGLTPPPSPWGKQPGGGIGGVFTRGA